MARAFSDKVEELIKGRHYELALALCDEELPSASSHAAARVWILRAHIHRAMGLSEQAVEDACKGLEVTPSNTALLFDRGLTLVEQGKFAAALVDMRSVQQIEAEGVWFGYAEVAGLFAVYCLLMMGRFSECLVACESLESDTRWWIGGSLRTPVLIADEARARLAAGHRP